MAEDMLRWASVPNGVGAGSGGELTLFSAPPPEIPDPRGKKPRHRPNNGRKRRFIGPFLEEPPWELLQATGYPVPEGLSVYHKVPSCWRRGPAYNKWRLRVFAMWGTVCHLCGHEGADSADHLIPLAQWGNQPYDPRISRPAHGIAGCPTCEVKCNSSRGNRQFAREVVRYKPLVAL